MDNGLFKITDPTIIRDFGELLTSLLDTRITLSRNLFRLQLKNTDTDITVF